ncbi:MAG: peptidase S8 [Cytophagia bacterium]|nr:MAG: peptidase S8 [Runella sp.]TAG18550.1 MAG: peptidase S8 [Cytophagales bacterium]TAG37999.1 MAG: peptidase S8 [Cytophagia bacterium]TAG79409.1 MAG: peptidase S8 [Cytophagales bacterium]
MRIRCFVPQHDRNIFFTNAPMKRYFCLIFAIFTINAEAQNDRYLILLKDKVGSPYSVGQPSGFLSNRAIQRRQRQQIAIIERDLPVNPSYISQLAGTGARVLYSSRWLNAVLVQADTTIHKAIKQLACYKNTYRNGPLNATATYPLVNAGVQGSEVLQNSLNITQLTQNQANTNYGLAKKQVTMLGADVMHNQNYQGQGMWVGVFDSGFLNANNLRSFDSLFTQNRVITTYDFVDGNANVFDDDRHGTMVLSCMAANWPNVMVGTAPKASYALFRTETTASETPAEEAYWLFAAERADSLGIDVINSSLGYFEFDNAAQNYKYTELNGNKALVTKAANWAVGAGMVVVNSAGNERANSWKYIIAPADGDSVLAIAAVDSNQVITFFSSLGPSADGRVKPDLAAMGLQVAVAFTDGSIVAAAGTSFSSPLTAGLVAGFWQAYPCLSAIEVVRLMRQAGNHPNLPDNDTGYGIPTFTRAATAAEAYFNRKCAPVKTQKMGVKL